MFGVGGRPMPTDLWVLLGILLATLTLQSFASVSALPDELRLTSDVRVGKVWQLATYPFVAAGGPSLWFLLSMFIVAMFGRDIYYRLGRKDFWRLLIQMGALAGLVAVAVDWIAPASWLAAEGLGSFGLMQGQNMILAILIAAFATLAGEATILLFFVLPIQAKWFLLLEVLFAFMGFLSSRDLAGFLGIVVAVVLTNRWLDRSDGNPLRRIRLQVQHAIYRLRLAWARKRRGLRVVKDETSNQEPTKGPWVH